MNDPRPCAALAAREVPVDDTSGYPAPFRERCEGVRRHPLGEAAGLTRFGVNLLVLAPGQWSAQRHWHSAEDELCFVLSGEVVLVGDAGEQRLTAGDFAGFPAGHADGHHLVNRSDRPAEILEMGTRDPRDRCHYPDVDLAFDAAAPAGRRFTHRDGRPW